MNDPPEEASRKSTPEQSGSRPDPDRMDRAVCLADYEILARKCLQHMAYEYVVGGAADEITLQANRQAFDRIRLEQRVLVDVSKIDTRLTLFGQQLEFPIVLAPTAFHCLIQTEGELATVRGANAAEITLVVSSLANVTIEAIAAEATRTRWYQLYVQTDRGFTRALEKRAEAAGYQAICVTVDTPVFGARNREARAKLVFPTSKEPVNLRGLELQRGTGWIGSGVGDIYSPVLDAALTWKDIEWLRSFVQIPVVLKGITVAEDAEIAVKAGVDGLIVSNHGARNLDTSPATIDTLPRVVATVAGRIPVMMDGGVRRGTDVLKALALGADAVQIGRPYLFGLAVNGSDGVKQVVDILRREFEMAMALTGRTSLAEIDESVLWRDTI